LHLSNIMIDVDGSPAGYVAWYNHHTEISRIRPLRRLLKNGRFGLQRMEMLAIYFALADNYVHFRKIADKSLKKGRQLIVRIRSDSKSTVDQLKGISEIRDDVLQRIYTVIEKLCLGMTAYNNSTTLLFNYLERTRNIAGLLLEQRRRKQRERMILVNITTVSELKEQ
jgi:DNA repair protein RadC